MDHTTLPSKRQLMQSRELRIASEQLNKADRALEDAFARGETRDISRPLVAKPTDTGADSMKAKRRTRLEIGRSGHSVNRPQELTQLSISKTTQSRL